MRFASRWRGASGAPTAPSRCTGTRMELLGFPGLQPPEEKLIQEWLRHLAYLPLIAGIEVLR
jgi:hypothetical protein